MRAIVALLLTPGVLAANPLTFDLEPRGSAAGHPVYDATAGFGFEPASPAQFSVRVPEGNYRVTLHYKRGDDVDVYAEQRRMYGHDDPDHPEGEDVIYYITMYNEPVAQPGAPDNLDVEALLRGMYHYASSPLEGDRPRAQILVSGVTMTAALKAQRILADEWGVAADVWSVTSWNELRRDAVVAVPTSQDGNDRSTCGPPGRPLT